MNIDVTKPVKTRDGRKARYIGTLKGPHYGSGAKLAFAVTYNDDASEGLRSTDASGSVNWGGPLSNSDIVQAPVTVEKFLNVYLHDRPYQHDVVSDAKISRSPEGTTLRLTYEDDKLVSVDILPD